MCRTRTLRDNHGIFIGRNNCAQEEICWYQPETAKLTAANVISTLFKGNSVFSDAANKINSATQTYTAAIVDLGYRSGMELVQQNNIKTSIKEISERLAQLVPNFENQVRLDEEIEGRVSTRENSPRRGNRFCVPYERNPRFIGREAILKQLHAQLRETTPKRYDHRIALHGLGGVGKTQTALEYVHRYRHQYADIFWLHASERSSITAGYAAVARETKCVPVNACYSGRNCSRSG
jgi:hypothetical protein